MSVDLDTTSVKTKPASILFQGGDVVASFKASPKFVIQVTYSLDKGYIFAETGADEVTVQFNNRPFEMPLSIRRGAAASGQTRVVNLSIKAWEVNDPDDFETGGCKITIMVMRSQREAMGMSVSELAAKADLDPRTVKRAEAGEDVRSSTIEALMGALG